MCQARVRDREIQGQAAMGVTAEVVVLGAQAAMGGTAGPAVLEGGSMSAPIR